MKLLLKLIIGTISVMVGAYVLPGITIDTMGTALIFAIVLGVINAFVKPLVSLFALPITILTLGLFSLVINAAMVMLAAYLVPGVSVAGFVAALLFSFVVALVSAFLNFLAN